MTFYWIADVGNYVVGEVRLGVFLAFCNFIHPFVAGLPYRGESGLLFINGSSLRNEVLLEKTIFFLDLRLVGLLAGLFI
jgi:hypothetical protein